MVAFGLVDRWIKFYQNITTFDALAVLNANRADDTGFKRLNDLAAAVCNDLPGRRGDEVDAPKTGPCKCQAKDRDDDGTGRPTDWRRGCFHDLEGGRQECKLVRIALDRARR